MSDKLTKRFKVAPLNVSKFVKINALKEITNPVFFNKYNQPTPDGLLSNEIFGITKVNRAGTFAYIDLKDPFISPPFYKSWNRLDTKIRECVFELKKFKIGPDGKLKYDENGSTGIKWLKSNIDKFKWKKNESFTHNRDVEFMTTFKDEIFITQFPVLPAFYRDVSTDRGRIQVGDINKLYNSLLIAARSLKETEDYGLNMNGAIRGRIQENLVEIYNWFAEEPQIGKKRGILRRANMAKTTDYSSRLVITCPNLNVESIDDLSVDSEHILLPLASLCVNFYPFVLYHLRRFFEMEFAGRSKYFDHDTGKEYRLKNYMESFSDNELKSQIDRFIHGYSNRFIPIEVPVYDDKNKERKLYMFFDGGMIDKNDAKDIIDGKKPIDAARSTIIKRRFTWCDAIFIAVTEAVKDKAVLVTRFPMDSYFNQFPIFVNVASTIKTESVILKGKVYYKYPYIREEDINIDTSNMFVDTANMPNVYLDSIGGDFDGDIISVKGIYSDEANTELAKQINSRSHYIGLDGIAALHSQKQAVHTMWCLTAFFNNESKLEEPTF